MEYQAEISRVVVANFEQLQHDLDTARQNLQRARQTVSDYEREVARLEALVDLAGERGTGTEPTGVTLHEAMATVLRDSGGRMRAVDLAAEVNRRHLYKMRDGRPVEPQQIHARVGNYPHLFAKDGVFITLNR